MAREDILRRNRDVEIRYPNREKPESTTARIGTAAILVLTALMMLVVAIGGWTVMTGAKPMLLLFVVLDLVFAYLVWNWKRGVLPVAAGTATMLMIFAIVSGPQWFLREHPGFSDATLPETLLGMITLGLVPVQMLLIVVSVWAFTQEWNVEEEVARGRDPSAPDPPDASLTAPAAQ